MYHAFTAKVRLGLLFLEIISSKYSLVRHAGLDWSDDIAAVSGVKHNEKLNITTNPDTSHLQR